MAAFGSSIPSEVGLRLLLCPLGSNIVLRTASCSVGVVLPVYSTFKALESRNQNEQQRWLLYWAAYGSFSIAEVFTDKFISWLPLYYHMKLAFLVWLQLPSVDGAKQLYMNHLRPFLLRHQASLDQIVGFLYSEMTKFVSANQGALQFVQSLLMKIFGTGIEHESVLMFIYNAFEEVHLRVLTSFSSPSLLPATQVAGSIFPPFQSKPSGAGRTIGGPTSREDQPRSEIEGPTPLVPNSESENDE